MPKLGIITVCYVGESVNYMPNAAWGDMEAAFARTWTPPRFDALLGRIAGLGFTHIELWQHHVQKGAWDPALVRDLVDKHGLTIASYCVSGLQEVEQVAAGYRYANALGVGMCSGFLSCHNTAALLDAMERYGDQYDVNYAIEPHGTSYSVVDPAQLREIFDTRSERIGLCPDTGWFRGEGYDPVAAVELNLDRVYHTHLRCTLNTAAEREPSAEPVLRLLKESGYSGVYSIEHEPPYDPTADLIEAREFVLKIVG